MKILITGGTGFMGKRLGAHFRLRGHEVLLAARNARHNLEASAFSGCPVMPMDVSDIESVRDVVCRTKPEIIIHAAATKFVDISEQQPLETLDINVRGSQNIARVAIDKGVQHVIGISTDKASPPVGGVYGMSKALMERLFCNLDGKSDTRFSCVRYGNVAWSTGSVLTVWRKKARANKVLGLTGAEYRRFFFTVEEAVALVNTAFEMRESIGGHVLSRRMKATSMQRVLEVWQQHEPIQYERIVTRGGERPIEFLFGEPELAFTTMFDCDGIPHYSIAFNQPSPLPVKEVLSSDNADVLTDDEIWQMISNPPIEEA